MNQHNDPSTHSDPTNGLPLGAAFHERSARLGDPTAPGVDAIYHRVDQRRKRRRSMAGVSAAAVLAVGVGSLYVVGQRSTGGSLASSPDPSSNETAAPPTALPPPSEPTGTGDASFVAFQGWRCSNPIDPPAGVTLAEGESAFAACEPIVDPNAPQGSVTGVACAVAESAPTTTEPPAQATTLGSEPPVSDPCPDAGYIPTATIGLTFIPPSLPPLHCESDAPSSGTPSLPQTTYTVVCKGGTHEVVGGTTIIGAEQTMGVTGFFYYTVKPGDSQQSVADKFGVQVEDLVSVDGSLETFKVGQQVGVPVSTIMTGTPLPGVTPANDPAIGKVAPVVSGVGFDGTHVTIDAKATARPTVVALVRPGDTDSETALKQIVDAAARDQLPRGVDFVSVVQAAMVPDQPPTASSLDDENWIKETGWNYPSLIEVAVSGDRPEVGPEVDWTWPASSAYGVGDNPSAWPAIVVIGPDGKVRDRWAGDISPTDLVARIAAAAN